MRKGKVSRSALNVAFLRALSNIRPVVPSFSDSFAENFLPPRFKEKLVNAQKRCIEHPTKSLFPFWGRGMGIFHQFRTVLLDRAINEAMPFDQFVILGAGLDSRAWRLEALHNTTVFEIDHPDTQIWKKKITSKFSPLAHKVCFVGVDFQRDDLRIQLANAGYNQTQRSFWLMEGVSPYLPQTSLLQILSLISNLAARGSSFAITYMNKNEGRVPFSLYLKLTGEPIITAFTPEEFANMLLSVNWVTLSDTDIEDWKQELTPTLKLSGKTIGIERFERIWIGNH